MTSNRAAERFARLVELDAIAPYLDTSEAALQPALALTAALRAAARTAPPAPLSADARAAMRNRLVAAANGSAVGSVAEPASALSPKAAAARATQRTRSASQRMGRRVSALIGSVVVVTSVAGVGVAAARSLPGNPFYDLKRATENVQLWLASGPAAKGERHLEFARTRLAEARALGAGSSRVASTLTAMNDETRKGSSDLLAAFRDSGSTQPLAELVGFTREQYAALARFGNSVPPRLQAQTVYSMTLLVGVAQDVRSMSGNACLTCLLTGSQPSPTPSPTSRPAPGTAPAGTTPTSSSSPAGSTPSSPGSGSPTGVVPTTLPTSIPTKLPSVALVPKHDDHRSKPVPTISPLPLLSSLKGIFGAK